MNRSQNPETLRLGVHVSVAGGVAEAVTRGKELGCTALQIFSRNPRGWKAAPLDPAAATEFRRRAREAGIDPVAVHTPYLLNLAAGEKALARRSLGALEEDIRRAEQLGARFVVTHIGSAGKTPREIALERAGSALRTVLRGPGGVSVLLENGSAAGNSLGATFAELAAILEAAGRPERLGVCFDSCHAFAAGYDFRAPFAVERLAGEIEETIGWNRLRLLHLNDCQGGLGSRRDRHEHIGRGKIGYRGFRGLLLHPRFRGLPMILETPKDRPGADRENMARVRRIFAQTA
jgi:deoxyribonuclease IV